MGNIFSGLEAMGLDKLDNIDLYADEKEKSAMKPVKEEPKLIISKELSESDYIFDKNYECPCCGAKFKSKAIRVGKARLIGSDLDLRPVYSGIDLNKYDVILCVKCGYSVLSRFFDGYLGMNQIKLIKENITSRFKPVVYEDDIYSYDEVLIRYKMALLCSVMKKAKISERAYTCLKLAWIYRAMAEIPENVLKSVEYRNQEKDMLKKAYEGFFESRSKENFPICGMDQITFDYLLGALAYECEDYDNASRLIGNVITSNGAKEKLKNRAREVRELIKSKTM